MKLTREEKIAKLKSIAKPANANANAKWMEIAKWNEEHADSLEDYLIIAMKIQKTLKEKKMTQKELATLLNVTPPALTRIMKGRQNISINKVRQIEKVLGISLMSIKKVDENSMQVRTRMVPVELHYGSSKYLFQGSVDILKSAGKREAKKHIGNLSIAS